MRWTLAVVFVLLAAGAALCMGPAAGVGAGTVWDVLTGAAGADDVGAEIVRTVRMPQVLLGLLVGAALSISGVLFQALLRNELAEPYLLGVGPGALAGVTAAAFLVGGGAMPGAWARGVAAFLGAIAVAVIVFSFARRGGRRPAVTVLLAGIAVGAFVHAIATGALHTLQDWHHVVRWLLGDLSLADYEKVAVLGGVLLLGGSLAWVRGRDLDVLTLGEEAAWYTGVEVRRALWLLGGVGCLLAAAAVAQCGLVGFIGLVVPHIGRRLFGPGHRGLIPAAALLGAGLLVLADALSRTLHPPQGYPLAVVTAVLGAPVLAWLVLRRVGA
ncbi:MAG: iron ABC transporter permease [Planctomycetota bacterium]|nr:iron ABC transporter permease [Planctomycetota bacterium]